jgi:hypothetical protein
MEGWIPMAHGLNLEQIYKDQDPSFFTTKGVMLGIARRFVSNIKDWIKQYKFGAGQAGRASDCSIHDRIKRNLASQTRERKHHSTTKNQIFLRLCPDLAPL